MSSANLQARTLQLIFSFLTVKIATIFKEMQEAVIYIRRRFPSSSYVCFVYISLLVCSVVSRVGARVLTGDEKDAQKVSYCKSST